MLAILVNIVRLGGMQVVIASTAIVRSKILAVRLGPEGYGEFIQLSLIVITASVVAAFGFGMSLNRNVAAFPGHGDRQRMLAQSNALNLTVASFLGAAVAILLLIHPDAVGWVGLSRTPDVVVSLAVLLAFIPLEAAVQHRVGFLTGALDIKGMTSGRSAALLLGTAASVPLVWFFGLIGAAVQFVLLTALIVFMLDRRCRSLGFAPWALAFDRATFLQLARLGMAAVIAGFATQVSDLVARSVLVRARDAAENGVYQAALSISHQVRAVVLGSVGSYMIATLSKTTDRQVIIETANRLLAVVVPLATVAFGVLGLLSGPAILVLYAPDFLPAQRVMPVLLAAYYVHVLIWVIGAPLLAADKVRTWLTLELVFSLSRLAIAVPLVSAMGAMAIALAYLLSTFLHLGLNLYFYRRVLRLSIAPRQWWLFGMGFLVTVATAFLGALHVFQLGIVMLGFGLIMVFAVGSVHAVIGLRPAWEGIRRAMGKVGER
jgi:enterobacterial common antigen flippase